MGAAREQAERGLELWNNGELDQAQSLWASDGVLVFPDGTTTGSDAIFERYRRDLATFPDRRITVHNWVEDGDTVVLEGEWSGTHSGPFTLPDGSQVPPTGQQLQIRLVSVFESKDGKIVAHRSYFDTLPTLMQLGLVAPTPQP